MFENRYPKEIILKDGQEIILKMLQADDGETLLRFYSELPRADRWFFKEDPAEAGVIARWIENQMKDRSLGILALCREQIVAHAGLLRRPFGSRQHIGRLRVVVGPDFRYKQLGTWLIFDLIRRAMDWGLDKVRADFVVGIEDPAIEAARKLDFVEEGLLRNYVQDENGQSHDYKIMIKHLHKEWGDF